MDALTLIFMGVMIGQWLTLWGLIQLFKEAFKYPEK